MLTASRVASCAVFAALLVASPLAAQEAGGLVPKVLTDPLDGTVFEWSVVLSTNGLGGFDSDGAAYSAGLQPRTFDVATSPTTLYSAPVASFGRPIPEADRTKLFEMLAGIGDDVDDARQLRPHERYEIAAAVAEFLGDGPFVVGELYLRGAWTVRDTIVGFLPGISGPVDAWTKLTETLPQVRAVESPRGRTIAFFDMARLCHRGGFNRERDDFLALIDTFDDAGLGAVEKRTEFFARVAEEGRLMSKAREAFTVGIKEQRGTAEERAYYRYLVGDIARRLGDFAEAEVQLGAVSLDATASAEVRGFAGAIQEVLKVQGRTESAVDPSGSKEESP